MGELAALLALALGAALWFQGIARRETAIDAARRACSAEGVQLLDDTAALASVRLRRQGSGVLTLARIYRFEFSDDGNNRLAGSVTLVGATVQALYLEPHRGAPPASRALRQRGRE